VGFMLRWMRWKRKGKREASDKIYELKKLCEERISMMKYMNWLILSCNVLSMMKYMNWLMVS
jgi:hypothetical protein